MNKLDSRTIRYFDMFAGVGGFRVGLDRAGGYECVGHCEIDKHADAAYRRLHKINKKEVFYEDATKIDTDTLPKFELIVAGFPCQSFSIAGKGKGFDDPRGAIFFDLAKVVEARKPKYLLFENVPGLLAHDGGRTFATILNELWRLRYHVEFQIINSKDHGVAQSRRRVFIVGYLDDRCAGQILPLRSTNAKTLIQLIDGRQDPRVYDPDGLVKTPLSRSGVLKIKVDTKKGYQEATFGDSVNISFASANKKRSRVGYGVVNTLDVACSHGVVTACGRIRRLMPRECFRLQGFTDSQIDKLLEGSSDAQAYKQAGNAVTVNVVHALAARLKRVHEDAVAMPIPITQPRLEAA